MSKNASPPSVRSLCPQWVAGAFGLSEIFSRSADDSSVCCCDVEFDERTLLVDANNCSGELAKSSACRRTVIEALEDREATSILVRSNGLEYRYPDRGVAVLAAAGRFIELVGERDERLADTATEDPLDVAVELEGRIGEIADIGVESGLLESSMGIENYDDILTPLGGPSIAHYFVDPSVSDSAQLRDIRTLETGTTARIYSRDDSVPLYELEVVDLSLGEQTRILLEGYEAIADGNVDGDRAPSRAIESVSDEPVDPLLTSVLRKHTSGYGILEDLFADPRITDVYATSPVSQNPIRVVVDGESMATNIYLTSGGSKALASRVRRTSGRPFSRAAPTVDATADLENGTGVRIAGVTDPVADGIAFAFREQADETFTLPALVENGTISASVAAFLSVAIERNAATLIAGTRGAGKTTLLGTLLYELTPDTRTVVIEDTPELPVDPLQSVGRDVQALRTGLGDGPEISPAEALRTALRLGDGALVVGEIRGEEARVLYEAMRVGANANAVLGTIHGDGAADVYERVVSDLKVEPSSFGATDLVVTVQSYRTGEGKKRRLARIEEVIGSGDDIRFEPLYALEGEQATSTGRIGRGESRLVDRLAGPTAAYADVRAAIESRTNLISSLAKDGRTDPQEVAAAYASRHIA
ncbi:type II/IV secretion system ATPase subunit [Halostagnicola sp. A-GB9-2]|uniref:type II/IV secretion system ATPase subunit n=1 Tax=Halostagnicola sp. A-GB9-2 TaxID=3048066 RepID=UPI0024BFCE94|nr:type II/IV secretion system ATPase subunit [Halostagnicola sp. A-GB9-2]MDJ1431441.1 type II/IV secretion system ATPase subunit [Halostagnicola sp. A-GB9-2]